MVRNLAIHKEAEALAATLRVDGALGVVDHRDVVVVVIHVIERKVGDAVVGEGMQHQQRRERSPQPNEPFNDEVEKRAEERTADFSTARLCSTALGPHYCVPVVVILPSVLVGGRELLTVTVGRGTVRKLDIHRNLAA
jgi:hypothetical protein